MKINQRSIEDILGILEETPVRFSAVSRGRSQEQLHHRPDPNSWSVNEVLAHLRACADVWGFDIDRMLAQDAPTLLFRHPNDRLGETDYPELDFETSLAAYCEQREEFLLKLKSLEIKDWHRGAEIQDRTHTVFSQARRMALHEQGHWEQIEAAVPGRV